jgi:hypothetical protein
MTIPTWAKDLIRLFISIFLEEWRKVARDPDKVIQDDVSAPKAMVDHYEAMLEELPGADVDIPKPLSEHVDDEII